MEQAHQGLGVQVLRHGGEAPDVGEQDGDLPALAPQAQLLGVFQHLLHHGGGHVGFKGLADALPLPLLGQEPLHGDPQVDQDNEPQGIKELQLQALAAEQEIVEGHVAFHDNEGEDEGPGGGEPGQDQAQEDRQAHQDQQHEDQAEGWGADEIAPEQVVHDGGLDFDARGRSRRTGVTRRS